MSNLELWNKVQKTNPKYTKNANVRGNKITSISPQFQIMNVTEQFGTYGEKWGFKNLVLDYSLAKDFGLVVLNATFFFPKGEFEIKNSISLFIDNAKTKVDNDFAKKIETDTLTKAISKLGFNADIFMGKFDDLRYIEEMNEEFNPEIKAKKEAELKEAKLLEEKQAKEVSDRIERNAIRLNACENVEMLGSVYNAFSPIEKTEMKGLTTELKEKLTLKTA
jgi:hypothetical protein